MTSMQRRVGRRGVLRYQMLVRQQGRTRSALYVTRTAACP